MEVGGTLDAACPPRPMNTPSLPFVKRRQGALTDMTTLFVLGMAAAAAMLVGFAWLALRAVLWLVFFPLMLLKAVFGMVFGLVFGIVGLVFGLAVAAVAGLIGVVALAAVLAVPLIPLLLIGGLVWLAVKGTTALATTA